MNVNILIPDHICMFHDRSVNQYLLNEKLMSQQKSFNRLWLKKKGGCILPVKISLKANLSYKYGIVITA